MDIPEEVKASYNIPSSPESGCGDVGTAGSFPTSADLRRDGIHALRDVSAPEPLRHMATVLSNGLALKTNEPKEQVTINGESILHSIFDDIPESEVGRHIYLSGLHLVAKLSRMTDGESPSAKSTSPRAKAEMMSPFQVQARASLILLPPGAGDVAAKPPVLLHYRALSVGIGDKYDVNLSTYGECCNVSDHHADIFYNESGAYYELACLSERGSRVDGTLYSTPPAPGHHQPPPDGATTTAATAVAVDYKLRDLIQHPMLAAANTAGAERNSISCNCPDTNPRPGWDGVARLHHGSIIKFGCIGFLFAVIPPHIK